MDDLERALAAYVEAIVADVLTRNWYRISRYPNSEMARPAIENVAREVRQRLREPVLAERG